LGLGLFGADVGWRPHNRIGLGEAGRGAFQNLGDAEIRQEKVAARIDEGVGRLEIAMDHALAVSITQGI
jgi:hypothetical protein